MARSTGILQRKRGIGCAVDLLRMLFLYASSNFSFRILAVAACTPGISSISDTAWRKQFSKAAPFLHKILHGMLSSLLPAVDASCFAGVEQVLLVDASVIRQQGQQQEQQRIHLCYSLNENRMKQVKVCDQHTAESLTHFSMGPGERILADAGYGTAQNYIYAQRQGADVILRITPKNFLLYDADGTKISLIAKLEEAEENAPEQTIFCSNTSTISPTELASYTKRPSQFAVMHFFNPVHRMRLVEMVKGLETSDETIQTIRRAAEMMGKQTVEVNEFPGFVTSRISALVGNEAFHMLQEGVASAEDIDKAVKLGLNYPMGPFELADLVGLDTRLNNLRYLQETLGEKYRPAPLLEQYVTSGRLGRKTARGVYQYTDEKS